MSKQLIALGAHRGMGCTDHDVYQPWRDIASLPVENTLHSLEASLKGGATYVEIDAVMSADGEVFLMHNVLPQDHFFGERPVGPLNTLPFESFAHDKTGRFQKGKIARMSEALELIAALDPKQLPFVLNIEIKGVQGSHQPYEENDFLEQVVSEVKKSALPLERVLWSSFAFMNVLRVSHLAPQSHFGMLFCDKGETKKTYSNHLDDMRYTYQEFEAPVVDELLNIWNTQSAVPDKTLYMHPEIKTMDETMLDAMAARNLSVNCWPFKEQLDAERADLYRKMTAYAVAKNVPLTIITDYLPEMQALKLKA